MSKEKSSSPKEGVTIIEPDYSLKKLVGDTDLKKIFSAENINKAQEVIETHKDSFLEWVTNDMQTLEDHYRAAMSNIPGCAEEIRKLAKVAFIIKSQAGTFGFALATVIAKSLDDFCNKGFEATAEHLTVVRKHIDTLKVIFGQKIMGDGGHIGAELVSELNKLVAKYQTKK